jgi:flagellar biosynthesis chaperone FliJ
MAVSRALRRLLRIRDLEEEQSRLALEASLDDLHTLQHALAATTERDRQGRRLVQASALNGEIRDRTAGLEETRSADRFALVLGPRIADAEQDVMSLREDYLDKRVERRQAETLIEEATARDTLDADRRSQQALDDWFGNRRHGQDVEEKACEADDSESAPRGRALDAEKAASEKTLDRSYE